MCDFCEQETEDPTVVATGLRLEERNQRRNRERTYPIDRPTIGNIDSEYWVGYDRKMDLCPFCMENLFPEPEDD